jgi:branched-subunit amino acid permease
MAQASGGLTGFSASVRIAGEDRQLTAVIKVVSELEGFQTTDFVAFLLFAGAVSRYTRQDGQKVLGTTIKSV